MLTHLPVFESSTCHLVRNAPPPKLSTRIVAYALASLRHRRFSLLSLLQRLHVRLFFCICCPYLFCLQLLLPYQSHIRSLHSFRLSHASCSICGVDGLVTNCRERVGTQGQDPVANSALLLALPSNQTVLHVHSQVECPAVHDRATRYASFRSLPPSLILLHSCFRCRHHHTVLRSPLRGKIFDTIRRCIYRSHRLYFHLGRPHGFDRLLRPDPSGAPGSPTTS